MPLKKLFLPHPFQWVGWIMSVAGIILAYLRFGIGIKPDFLEINVFAIYSTYFDSKYFQVIQNNISEEICGITVVVGLFFLAFSREKKEEERFWDYRLKALMISLYVSTLFLLLTFFFFFGLAFVTLLTIYMILPQVIYIAVFRLQLYNNRRMKLH